MKKALLTLILLASGFHSLSAQHRSPNGGGEVKGPTDQLTLEQRNEIKELINFRIDSLKNEGVIQSLKISEIEYGWPIQNAKDFFDFSAYGISNFVDHDSGFPNQLSDYFCGTRSYDLDSGYNHQGIDIYNWPFTWYKMDNDQVEVIAVADGIIIDKRDGNFDRNCALEGGNWNAVYVRHIDGSVVWYGHLKNGSTTSKNIGETIERGEYIGVVGSSGNSTGPHLHIEFYDPNGKLIDPYSGPCNDIGSSLWASQPAYYDSKINALKTHLIPPEFYFQECSKTEEPNFQDAFLLGDEVKTAAYYRDQLDVQTSDYSLIRPDQTVRNSWSHNSNSEYYSSSYWYWNNTIPVNEQVGVWEFRVVFLGNTYTHEFTISDPTTVPLAVPLRFPFNDELLESDVTKLRWLPLADADSYHLQVSTTDDFSQIVKEESQLNESFFNLEDIETGGYFWRVKAQNIHGTGDWSPVWEFRVGSVTSNEETFIDIPGDIKLDQNYPNPFNPNTIISFTLNKPNAISLKVFNLMGQEISVLKEGKLSAGSYSFTFDASNLSSGVYLYRLETPGYSETKRMLLIK